MPDRILKILHIEDLSTDAKLVSQILSHAEMRAEITVIDTKEQFQNALKAETPDLILSDHSLPAFNSYKALELFKETGLQIPFILITSNMSEEFAVDVIHRGADDYILKDRLQRLPSAIVNALEKCRLAREQEKLYRELIKNEKYYHALIDNYHDATVLLNRNGEVIYLSPAVERLNGFTPMQLSNRSFFPNIHPEDRPAFLILFEQVCGQNGPAVSIEFRMLHLSGHYIWIEGAINNLLGNENVRAVIINYKDVTEKKELENLLLKTNELARLGSWELDLVNDTLYWSPEIRKMHEVDESFVPGIKGAIDFFRNEEDRDLIQAAFNSAIADNTTWCLDLRLHTTKGNTRWVRTIGEAEFVHGICTRVYGSLQDIDTEKRAELEVKRMWNEKNIILESINDGFFALDKTWKVTYWNQKAELIMGYPKDEVLGKNIWDVYEGTMDTTSFMHMHKAMEMNEAQHFEAFYSKLNHTYETTAYPSSSGLSVYFKDITDRKKLEQKILDDKVKNQMEITKAVIHAQEKERAEIGQELHDNVCQLLAASKLYLDHSLTEEDKHVFIKKGQAFIEQAITEVRKLSHALVGPTEDMMMGIVQSVAELIENITLVNPIKIDFHTKDFSESDIVPELKLIIYRIIQEQVTNVMKHAMAEKIVISLESNPHDLTLTIFDDGKGFDTAASRKGIGLKNIRNRASMYHGALSIESSPGKGCTLQVVFT